VKQYHAFPLFLLAVSLLSGHSSASVLPSSATFNWGYTQDLGTHGNSVTAIPSLSATWHVRSHLAVRSNVAYIQDQSFSSVLGQRGLANGTTAFSAGEQQPVNRSEFLPLAAGLRFYAGGDAERTRGLFLDATPAVFFSRLPDGAGGHLFRAPLGFELGAGVRVPGIDGSRVELGLSYFHSSASGPAQSNFRPALEPRTESFSGWSMFSLYIGIGIGD